VSPPRNDDAGFALDRLDQEGDGIRRDRGFQRQGVAERDDPKARCERPEMRRVSGSVEKPTMARVAVKLSAQTMNSACPSGTPFTS
jgi:hypothetical protein